MLERLLQVHPFLGPDEAIKLQHLSAGTSTQANVAACLASGRWTVYGLDTVTFTHVATALSEGPTTGNDCDLLGTLGIAMQVAITVVCAVALICVWLCETPRRAFLTWVFDISKQVVGAAYGKLYNIAQSVIFASMLSSSLAHQDQCVWYLMSIAVDCLFLTFLLWGACAFTRPILLQRYGIDIGEYDEPLKRDADADKAVACDLEDRACDKSRESCLPEQVQSYLVQLFIWLGIITAVRLCVSVLLFLIQFQLYEFFSGVFTVLGLVDPTSKLVFAVLVFPSCADTFQIVVQDRFLKKQK